MIQRAESIRVMHPLFQAGEGGSTPTSALQLSVQPIESRHAGALNRLWHSRLPKVKHEMMSFCYAAEFQNIIYAVAMWGNCVARMLPRDWLELRRLAISPDAPPNTASRMLSVMTRLIRHRYPECTRLVSYQDCSAHKGVIYRAAGWIPTRLSEGGEWTRPSKYYPKVQSASPKQRWEKAL